jgi:hypothetical protein
MRLSRTALAVVATVFAITMSVAAADPSPVGTWVKKGDDKMKMTMTIAKWGNGKAQITWNIKSANLVLSVVSALDGKDAPVLINGKASGETMAITRVDKLHATTVVKMNGKQFGTSKGTYSADFKTLTVENDFSESGGGNAPGKSTEIWIRK